MKSKKVTIKDIAEKAGVSKSTVSRVLNDTTPVNEEKRKAVEAAMEQLDFKPNIFARSLAGGQSFTIGVITQNIGSPFYDQLTQSLLHSFSQTDYSPLIADGKWDPYEERTAIETLIGRQIDGLLVVGGTLSVDELLEITEDKPTVILARDVESELLPCVYTDNIKAGFDATQFLIERGHKRIAHIKGIETHQDAIRRYEGYLKALRENGIEVDEDLIFQGNFSGPSGVLAMESLISRKTSFSAVFAANDEMAYGARLALYRKGIRVPEDVSIIGFDNQPLSAFVTPPLTTVQQPAEEIGLAATEMLLGLISGTQVSSKITEAKLVHRESVLRIG